MSENRSSLAGEPKFFRLTILCLVAFAALNATMVWRLRSSIAEGYGDFTSFYTAGKIVSTGQSARLYDAGLQWQIQQPFAANVKIRRGPLPYIRPPFEALLFLPLSYFPYPWASVVWLTCKIVFLFVACLLMPEAAPLGEAIGSWKFRVLVCLAFFPVGFDLVQGQDSILLLLLLTLSLRLLRDGEDFFSGAVLALGLFKFHLIVPLFLIIALKKRTRFTLGFAAVSAVLFLISLAMVGWSGIVRYPKYLWTLKPELGVVRSESMPNFRGMLTVLMGHRSLPVAAQALLLAIGIAGVALAAYWWRSARTDSTMRGFSSSIAIVLVTSYYANSYDLTLLLLPLLVVGESLLRSQDAGWRRTVFIACAAVLLCTPLLWLLALKADMFCWLAVVLVALGISTAGIGGSSVVQAGSL